MGLYKGLGWILLKRVAWLWEGLLRLVRCEQLLRGDRNRQDRVGSDSGSNSSNRFGRFCFERRRRKRP